MDMFYIIKETEINIGLKRVYRFIQISDTHICAFDELSTDDEIAFVHKRENDWKPVKEMYARNYGDPFGKEHDLPMQDAFVKLMDFTVAESPEAVLFTGDILDNMHPAGERLIRKELERYGGKYLCVPGNHENETLDGVWGGVKTLDFDGFSIVALDNRKKTVTDKTLADLKAVIEKGVPLIVIMHVPIATAMNIKSLEIFSDEKLAPNYFVIDEENCDDNAKELIKLLKSENVKAVLCGHVHGWHESEYAPGKKQYCNSAGMIGNIRKLTVK